MELPKNEVNETTFKNSTPNETTWFLYVHSPNDSKTKKLKQLLEMMSTCEPDGNYEIYIGRHAIGKINRGKLYKEMTA